MAAQNEARSARVSSLRRTIYRILENAENDDALSKFVDIGLVVLIIASVLSVILESIPSVAEHYSGVLYQFEVFTITIFTLEYLLRVWVSIEMDSARADQPVRSRLRFMCSFQAIIDLMAILPFYVLLLGNFVSVDTRFLRAARLLRILKLTRYFAALNMLILAVKDNSRALGASFLILVTVMLFAASGMYYFERTTQPIDFGSIPAAMWWAFATLTTVGYGDVTPITVGGKIFGALITVVGVGMVALPTSILASGYAQQLRLNSDVYQDRAVKAMDDGVLTDVEKQDLESLRLDLGLGKHTASQILDSHAVQAALRGRPDAPGKFCPHCGRAGA